MTQIFEPYGEIFKKTTAGTAAFDSPEYRPLPAGVSTVMVTWTGEKHLVIGTRRNGTPGAALGTIPAGTGRRSTVISGIGVSADEVMEIRMTTATDQPAGAQAVITVVTTPLKGAGGGSLRKVLGAARRIAGWAK